MSHLYRFQAVQRLQMSCDSRSTVNMSRQQSMRGYGKKKGISGVCSSYDRRAEQMTPRSQGVVNECSLRCQIQPFSFSLHIHVLLRSAVVPVVEAVYASLIISVVESRGVKSEAFTVTPSSDGGVPCQFWIKLRTLLSTSNLKNKNHNVPPKL